MNKQPEALRLADSISRMDTFTEYQRSELQQAAAELRRLHEVNQELLKALTEATAAHELGILLSGTGTKKLRAVISKAGDSNAT